MNLRLQRNNLLPTSPEDGSTATSKTPCSVKNYDSGQKSEEEEEEEDCSTLMRTFVRTLQLNQIATFYPTLYQFCMYIPVSGNLHLSTPQQLWFHLFSENIIRCRLRKSGRLFICRTPDQFVFSRMIQVKWTVRTFRNFMVQGLFTQ